MDYEAWAGWYDIVHLAAGEAEARFYVERGVVSGGPVLELGAGTGRIAIPMAQAGLEVVGVDLHAPMLLRARAKLRAAGPVAGRVDLVQADMRELHLGRRFPLVTIPGRTLLLLTSARDQRRALRRAAAHVTSGGRLILNVFNPAADLLADPGEPFLMAQVKGHDGARYRLWARNRFDTIRQTNRGVQAIEEVDASGKVLRRQDLAVRVRYLYPAELHLMLRAAGLRVLETYGDFSSGPLTPNSHEMVFVAEKAV